MPVNRSPPGTSSGSTPQNSQRKSSRILQNSEKNQQSHEIHEKIVKKRGRPAISKKIILDDDESNLVSNLGVKNTGVHEIPTNSNNIYNHLTDDCSENVEHVSKDYRTKKKPCTPIILTKNLINPKDTIKKIKGWTENTVHFRSVKDGISIITYSKNDYDLIKLKLKEINFEFYTFTHFEDRPKKLVLKGMSQNYELEEILEDLKLQSENMNIKILSINFIYRHLKKRDTNEIKRVPSNKYIVYFSSDSDLNYVINNLMFICDHKIAWEPYIKKFIATQCRRCQKFGHAAANCNNLYRCVKCTAIHGPGECLKLITDKPKCVNCNEDHSANYKNCPKFIEYTKRTQRYKNQELKVPEKGMNFVNPRISYKEVLNASSITNENDEQPNNFLFMINEIKLLFNTSMEDLMLKIKAFMPVYSNTSDQTTKMSLLISFLAQFV